ncbi:CTR copper uptake transporter [Mycena sanguinolenta]|uniref:CTR copper uptake transporter n=1 Tax=Mycena sanguinolenta TaxID=230812 RepID=A0A8H6YFE1_9AGAR|nr:CTR copper uptake transporter [Mycena sanguinolenta]
MSLLLAFVLPLLPRVCAETNGMDMSMDDGMTMAAGAMIPYLHFTLGDILWFNGWVPQSKGRPRGGVYRALCTHAHRPLARCCAEYDGGTLARGRAPRGEEEEFGGGVRWG